ncbi:hypothetical protein Hanom_Chr02g00115951 [Helianthus anomalus]
MKLLKLYAGCVSTFQKPFDMLPYQPYQYRNPNHVCYIIYTRLKPACTRGITNENCIKLLKDLFQL